MDNQFISKKEIAGELLKLSAIGKSREIFGKYVGRNFIHHNVYFKADAETLLNAMEENAKENPNKEFEILRILEDGDLVAVHSRARQNPLGQDIALVHIFRFEENKIVELWDVGQPVPENCINENGMF